MKGWLLDTNVIASLSAIGGAPSVKAASVVPPSRKAPSLASSAVSKTDGAGSGGFSWPWGTRKLRDSSDSVDQTRSYRVVVVSVWLPPQLVAVLVLRCSRH